MDFGDDRYVSNSNIRNENKMKRNKYYQRKYMLTNHHIFSQNNKIN